MIQTEARFLGSGISKHSHYLILKSAKARTYFLSFTATSCRRVCSLWVALLVLHVQTTVPSPSQHLLPFSIPSGPAFTLVTLVFLLAPCLKFRVSHWKDSCIPFWGCLLLSDAEIFYSLINGFCLFFER